jgi:hypothetical protein
MGIVRQLSFGIDPAGSADRPSVHGTPAAYQHISYAVRNWMGNAPQHDDVTFIVMKVNELNRVRQSMSDFYRKLIEKLGFGPSVVFYSILRVGVWRAM